jgi:hypothetical protein
MRRDPKHNRPVIFRRFRKVPGTNKVLDAHDYGLKAWPMRIVPS